MNGNIKVVDPITLSGTSCEKPEVQSMHCLLFLWHIDYLCINVILIVFLYVNSSHVYMHCVNHLLVTFLGNILAAI